MKWGKTTRSKFINFANTWFVTQGEKALEQGQNIKAEREWSTRRRSSAWTVPLASQKGRVLLLLPLYDPNPRFIFSPERFLTVRGVNKVFEMVSLNEQVALLVFILRILLCPWNYLRFLVSRAELKCFTGILMESKYVRFWPWYSGFPSWILSKFK